MSEPQKIVIVGEGSHGKSLSPKTLRNLAEYYDIEVVDELPQMEWKILSFDECDLAPTLFRETRTKADRKRNKRTRWS